jgi:hypothetical protein
MRIGIDARMMGANNTRGIGRYIQELYAAMVQTRPDLEFVVFAKTCNHALNKYPNVETVIADINWYGFKEQISLLKIFRKAKVDLMHFPHWNVPVFYNGPFVLTIHDLLLKHKKHSAKASTRFFLIRLLKRMGYKMVLDNAIKKASAICVPTNFVAEDLEYYFPEQKQKILVTGEGITKLSIGANEHPHYQYFLYAGSAYPHKRLDLLLQAWNELSKIYPDQHLIVAGEMDIFMERVKKQARFMDLQRVHFLGSVTDEELGCLYQNANVLIFPSEFEGFGLPPFEALSLGTPVVSSDARPMADILGNKGVVYFKSGDKDGMIEAVKAVVDNLESMRNQAKNAGQSLQEKFNWEHAALLTMKAYDFAINS